MSKKRSIAGFGDVASEEQRENLEKINLSSLDDIVNVNANVSNKRLIGIYFEQEVADILKELAKSGNRGIQSKIVNEAVKRLFQEKGLL